MKEEYRFKVKNIKRCNDMAGSLEDTITELRQLKNEMRAEERRIFKQLVEICEHNRNGSCIRTKRPIIPCELDNCFLCWSTK